MPALYTLLFLLFQLVTPASDLLPGQAFTVTLESIGPATLDIDSRFDVLSGDGSHHITYAGGGVLAIRLRVRSDAAPGVVRLVAYSGGRSSSGAWVSVCCRTSKPPARGWRLYFAVFRG
jgi:hypothetical protein